MCNRNKGYFFHHPLKPNGHPGRVGFAVIGNLLGVDGLQKSSQFRIFADGFGENILGANQDPCVFADPVPLVHAFCKIDDKGGKYYVEDCGNYSLAQIVQPGDVIFYGSIKTSKNIVQQLFIDMVLVVEKSIEWPTGSGGKGRKIFRLMTDKQSLHKLKKEMNITNNLPSTSVWKFCLRDSECGHRYTAWNPHMIILGVSSTQPDALSNVKTSFVPVVPESAEEPLTVLPDKNLEIQINSLLKKYPRLCGSIKPVVPLNWGFTLELYHKIIQLSGPEKGDHVVAVPPLTPLAAKWRPSDKPCDV